MFGSLVFVVGGFLYIMRMTDEENRKNQELRWIIDSLVAIASAKGDFRGEDSPLQFSLSANQLTIVKLWRDRHLKDCPVKGDVPGGRYTISFRMNDTVEVYIACICGTRLDLNE